MKFITLFAALASVAYAQYCPITSGSCDTNKKPNGPKTGKIIRQYLVDGFSCSGTIEIVNDCTFNVKDFSITAPDSKNIKWYGAEQLNSSKGGNLLSNTVVEQSTDKKDFTVTTGDNAFCRASLVDHIGSISLMDDQNRVICYADLNTGSSSSDSSSSSSSSNSSGSSSSSSGSSSSSSSSGSHSSSSGSNSSSSSDSSSSKASSGSSSGSSSSSSGSSSSGSNSSAGASAGTTAAAAASAAPTNAGTVNSSVKPGNSTAGSSSVAGNTTTNNNSTSGVKSAYMIPTAFYVALLSLALYLYN